MEMEKRPLGLETRPVKHSIRLKKGDGDLPVIEGYAAVYDMWSEDLGGFREIIRPGAFTNSLQRGDDVRALIDHDSSRIIGRTKSGTLSIRDTRKGLRVEIRPPDTASGRDLVTSIKRGDLDGMSFAFRTVSDRWGTENEEAVRELLEADLRDVSVVAFPAYPQTEVALRSLAAFQATIAPTYPTDVAAARLRLAEIGCA